MTTAREPAAVDAAEPWRLSPRADRALDAVMSGVLDERAAHLAEPIRRTTSSGKRLRPAVVLAAAGALDPPPAAHLTGAAAVEMLHWATLVHDDAIDDADYRHGHPTVNAEQGVSTAIVAGDLLIGASFVLAAGVGAAITAQLARTLTELCVGQAREEAHRWRTDVNEADVLVACAGKTGSLLGAAAHIGGLCAGRSQAQVQALHEFGVAFGVSLQIMDDLLDVTSSAERLGKPVAADFAGGTTTVLGAAAMRHRPELRELLHPAAGAADHQRALDLLRAPDALLHAVEQAWHWAATAADHIHAVADGDPALDRLSDWPADYVEHITATKMEPRWSALLGAAASRRRMSA